MNVQAQATALIAALDRAALNLDIDSFTTELDNAMDLMDVLPPEGDDDNIGADDLSVHIKYLVAKMKRMQA